MIWIEAAFFVDQEMQAELKQHEVGISVDIRSLLKDIDDIQRLKASGGKKSSLIKWEDLPSQSKNEVKKDSIENNVEIRKAFLKNLSDRYKNK